MVDISVIARGRLDSTDKTFLGSFFRNPPPPPPPPLPPPFSELSSVTGGAESEREMVLVMLTVLFPS